MQFSTLLALAPALAVVSALPNAEYGGYSTPACTAKTIYSTSTGYSESCSTGVSTAYKPVTNYKTETITKTSSVPVMYTVTETSTYPTSVAHPVTSRVPVYETETIVKTSYKEVVSTSYAPSNSISLCPVIKTSTKYMPYTECITSSSVGSVGYPVTYSTTIKQPWTHVSTSVSTCPAPTPTYGY